MLTLGFTFITGRYHATAWDHQVNEGTVEWPPSPWRIVRALASAAYKVVPPLPPERVRSTLEALRGLPSYRVPHVEWGHTRHFMPLRDETALVFDTFAVPGRSAELLVTWPEASPDDPDVLRAILDCLGYLGRAESWVAARVVEGQIVPNLVPEGPTSDQRPDVRLMALMPDNEFLAWRATRQPLEGRGRRSKRWDPSDWWDILHVDTRALEAWSQVPGTCWVNYRFSAPVSRPGRRRRASSTGPLPTIARFAITSPVMPLMRVALPIAERFRSAALSRAGLRGAPPEVVAALRGSGAAGAPGDHAHAFILPTPRLARNERPGARSEMAEILVYFRNGVDRSVRAVLEDLRWLWDRDAERLGIILTGLGRPLDFGCSIGRILPGRTVQLGPSRVWESLTPFLAPRHTKHRGGRILDSPESQARRLLVALGLPEPSQVEALDPRPFLGFVRRRRRGGGRPGDGRLHRMRIVFDRPVLGPIAIGYGAHFGLGQFFAVQPTAEGDEAFELPGTVVPAVRGEAQADSEADDVEPESAAEGDPEPFGAAADTPTEVIGVASVAETTSPATQGGSTEADAAERSPLWDSSGEENS